MDFDLEDKKNSDDDIIELTEIIEKGPAASQVTDQAVRTEQDLEASFSDLGNTNNAPNMSAVDDVDLDALLAQMDSDGGFSELEAGLSATDDNESASPVPAGASPAAEPEMLDLAEVDALLAEMDMPPQPGDVKAQSVAEETSSNDMDDLLGSILNEPAKPESAKQSSSQALGADKESFNAIDELFDEVLGEAPLTAAELAQNVVPGGDIDADVATAQSVAELVSAGDGQGAKDANQKAPAPEIPDLSDDLDAILSASELETQNASTAANAAASEAVADAAMPKMAADKPKQGNADDARLKSLEKRVDTLEKDLASRFAILQESVEKATESSAKENADVRAGLAELANKVEEVSALQSEAADNNNDDVLAKVEELRDSFKQVDVLSEKITDLETAVANTDELTEKLVGFESTASTVEALSEKIGGLESSVANIETLSEKLADLEGSASNVESLSEKIGGLESSVANIETLSEKLADLETAVGDILQGQSEGNASTLNEEVTAQLEEMNAKLEGLESSVNDDAASQLTDVKTKLHALERSAANVPVIVEKLEALEAVAMQLSEAVDAMEAAAMEVSELQASAAQTPNAKEEQEHGSEQLSVIVQEMTEKLQAVENSVNGAVDVLHEKVEKLESTVAEQGGASADVVQDEEASAQMEKMSVKLDFLEASLEAAKEREDAMKEIIAAQITKLESSINSANEAQDGASQVQDSAVSTESEELKAKVELLESALGAAEDREKSQQETIVSLEEKLQELGNTVQGFEQNLQENLEKMAAAAAAKVLREEIAALLGEEG